jgi:hypothetical protein
MEKGRRNPQGPHVLREKVRMWPVISTLETPARGPHFAQPTSNGLFVGVKGYLRAGFVGLGANMISRAERK